MAMSISDIFLHMAPYLAEYQEKQRRLGIDMPVSKSNCSWYSYTDLTALLM